ncbi:hypothetical protein HQ705_11855 [Enterococcus faecium]|nr:hypothetical protein [Enterococcus faecium]
MEENMSDKMNTSYHNKAMPKIEKGMWQVEDHTQGEECVEELMFMMKDKYHEFSLGLSTVLKCLAIAEKEGYVPPLSDDWWLQIRQI